MGSRGVGRCACSHFTCHRFRSPSPTWSWVVTTQLPPNQAEPGSPSVKGPRGTRTTVPLAEGITAPIKQPRGCPPVRCARLQEQLQESTDRAEDLARRSGPPHPVIALHPVAPKQTPVGVVSWIMGTQGGGRPEKDPSRPHRRASRPPPPPRVPPATLRVPQYGFRKWKAVAFRTSVSGV